MNSVSEVCSFLQWYRENREEPPEFDDVPTWLDDRTPDPSQELNNMLLLENYDLGGRLYDEPPGNVQEWMDPSDNIDFIERAWSNTVAESGLEAFAWYVPFHYSTRRWGIYVNEEGLQILGHLLYEWSRDLIDSHSGQTQRADEWTPSTPSGTITDQGGRRGEPSFEMLPDAFELALEILLRHEWYHHQVELLGAYIEEITDTLHYTQYYDSVYRATFPTKRCIEEAAANAYVYRSQACMQKAPSTDVFRALFHRTIQSQPEAYQEYLGFNGSDFQRAGQNLAHQIKTADSNLNLGNNDTTRQAHLGAELPFGTALRRPRNHVHIPIYIVKPQLYDLETLSKFKTVQLDTNYDIIKTTEWEKRYAKEDGNILNKVDNTVQKLEQNVNFPGFNWQDCSSGHQYIRINDQYRMIVTRDDAAEKIELVDFGHHDLPAEYGCY